AARRSHCGSCLWSWWPTGGGSGLRNSAHRPRPALIANGSGWKAKFSVDGAVVATRHWQHRGGTHSAPRVEQDMVDRQQSGAAGINPPGRGQSFAELAGGIRVAAAEPPPGLRVIEGGGKVSGQE